MQSGRRDPLIHTLLSVFIPLCVIYWLWIPGKNIQARFNFQAPNIWLIVGPTLAVPALILLFFIGLRFSLARHQIRPNSLRHLLPSAF